MNEIEKLYENCNIQKAKCGYCSWHSTCPYDDIECGDDCPYWKYEDEAKYPPFTAEKQLELIKWLAVKGDFDYTVDIAKNTDAYWTIYFDDSRWTAEEFEEALAGLINQRWQDLTEEEKEQIRSVLNG